MRLFRSSGDRGLGCPAGDSAPESPCPAGPGLRVLDPGVSWPLLGPRPVSCAIGLGPSPSRLPKPRFRERPSPDTQAGDPTGPGTEGSGYITCRVPAPFSGATEPVPGPLARCQSSPTDPNNAAVSTLPFSGKERSSHTTWSSDGVAAAKGPGAESCFKSYTCCHRCAGTRGETRARTTAGRFPLADWLWPRRVDEDLPEPAGLEGSGEGALCPPA